MKKLIFPLSLILLVISLAGATFLGTGTYYLVSEKVFQMNDHALQTTQEEEEVRTLLEELEKNLDTKLVKYFLEHGEDEGDTDSYLALRLSEWILQIGMEEGWDAAKAAAKKYHVEYYVKHENGRLIGGNLSVDELDKAMESIVPYHPDTAEVGEVIKYRVYIRFDKGVFQRILLQNYQLQTFWIKYRFAVAGGFAVLFVVSTALFLLAGRYVRRKSPDRETGLDRLPLDLTICVCGYAIWYLLRALYQLLLVFQPGQVEVAIALGAGAVFLLLSIILYIIWRLKHKGWYRGTLCHWIWTWIAKLFLSWKEIFENLSLTWKLLLFELFLYLMEAVVIAIFFYWEDDLWRVLCALALVKIALIPWILRVGIAIEKIRIATHELAQGRYDAQIDVSRLPRPMQGIGEDVNSMAGSISVAVEERTRSERLKTELITNVSHDIKTPLTSIINFSDMIRNEKTENEKITEYAEHLHKQSSRLKKLIEDLMEASKASTGNLEVHLEPCEVKVLLGQCLGEFEPRLQEKKLELVVRQCEEQLRILADHRMLWRVFENLMNNICKYAQADTRVYLSARQVDGQAEITFKNVSKYALDVPPEELMERFVRGDLSRHTEGSGLGLSIVSSLMELQGGKLQLSTDGDLFKAILTFPLIA